MHRVLVLSRYFFMHFCELCGECESQKILT
nr:MAG TPA: hypothetical protein [Caudoviricetes sp.]